MENFEINEFLEMTFFFLGINGNIWRKHIVYTMRGIFFQTIVLIVHQRLDHAQK